MEKSYKVITFCVVLVMILGSFILIYNLNNKDIISSNIDSVGNPLALLYSSVSVREPTQNDIETNTYVKGIDGNVYKLFNSRSLDKFDYGKTFVVRVK